MFHLLSFLASILTGLRAAVAQVAPRGRTRMPAVTLPSDHLDHMFACFERLYLDWRNGTLHEPCERAELPATGIARPSRPPLPDPAMTVPPEPVPSRAPSVTRPASSSRPHRPRSPAPEIGEAIINPTRKKTARLAFDPITPISFRFRIYYILNATH